MEFTPPALRGSSVTVTDVYTDLQGLQGIKTEENDEALKKVAQQFESLFVSMMLKNMRSANEVFSEGSMFNSKESKFYQDMMDQQLSLTLSHGKGLGIADVLYRQLSRQQGGEAGNQLPRLSEYQSAIERAARSQVAENTLNPISGNSIANNTDYVADTENKHVNLSSPSSTQVETPLFDSPESFIRGVYDYAKSAAEKIGIDAETLVAQAALETGWGKHIVSDDKGNQSNNLFNIKSNNGWQGDSVAKTVVEYENGTVIKENANFRKYNNLADSFEDYSAFVTENPRYSRALEANSSEEYLKALKDSGFATDPHYVEKIQDVRKRVVDALGSMAKELLFNHLGGSL